MPEIPSSKRIISCVVCDDIREEITGKLILVGVYTGNIVAPHNVGEFSWCTYIEYMPTRAGKDYLTLIYSYNGEEGLRISVDVDISDVTSALGMHFPSFTVPISGAGDLEIHALFSSGEKEFCARKKITRLPEVEKAS